MYPAPQRFTWKAQHMVLRIKLARFDDAEETDFAFSAQAIQVRHQPIQRDFILYRADPM